MTSRARARARAVPVLVRYALDEAEALRGKALKRIVIRFGHEKLWTPAWARLV